LAETDLIQFSIPYAKRFLNWLRTRCVVWTGFHNNSSDLTHLNSKFLGWHRTTYHRQRNRRVAKRLWGCVSAERQHSNTRCNFWYRKTFYYSDRNTVCLKRFNITVHKAA